MGERLKELRGRRPLEEVAVQVPCAAGSLSRYENGRVPDADIAYRLALIYGVTVEWLLSGQKKKASHSPDLISEGEVAYQVDKLKKAKEILARSRKIHQHLEKLMKEEGEKMGVVEELLEVFPPPQFYRAVGEK